MSEPVGFGIRLRQARDKARLTQPTLGKAVAERIGRSKPLSASAVQQWEAEKTQPGIEELVAISVVLSVSFDWLLTGKGDADDADDPPTMRKREKREYFPDGALKSEEIEFA